jgi:hypothetical protein
VWGSGRSVLSPTTIAPQVSGVDRAAAGRPSTMTVGRITATAATVLAAGLVLLLATDAIVANAIGWALVGIAGVLLVSLAFLLVGQSEDRDREQRPGG